MSSFGWQPKVMCMKYQIVELVKKNTDQSIVINRSRSQPDPRINLMQRGSRAGNVGSRTQLIS